MENIVTKDLVTSLPFQMYPRHGAASVVPNRVVDVKPPPDDSCAFQVACVADKNARKRRKMEDAHLYLYNYDNTPGQGLFCIFDGHAGSSAAQWCQKNFPAIFQSVLHESFISHASSQLNLEESFKFPSLPSSSEIEEESEREIIEPSSEGQEGTPYKSVQLDIQWKLNETFMRCDKELADDPSIESGCTVTVALFKPLFRKLQSDQHNIIGTLYTANVGDGRIVLCQGSHAIRLSYDHKASDLSERQRITESGGFIVRDRVAGIFAITRSLGDEDFKNFVIGRPFTTKLSLNKDSRFLILACDGLWDVCSDQHACDLLLKDDLYKNPEKAAMALVDFAINHCSSDNLSVMVVSFKETDMDPTSLSID